MIKLMALLLTLILTACAQTSMLDVKQAPPPAVAPAPEPVHFTVETRERTDSALAEDGTLLAEYRFTLPVLSVCREDGTEVTAAENAAEQKALEAAAAFNEKFDKWAAAEEFGEVVEGAAEYLDMCREWEMDWGGPYTLGLDCTVYQTEQLVSVAGTYYSYTGGAHSNTYLLGWNFDLDTGEFFNAKALSDGTALQDYVAEELTVQACSRAAEADMAPTEMFWEEYETVIADWSSYAVSFDESGMTVAFSPYELACYAAGPQEFTISYEKLTPHLNQNGHRALGAVQ